MRPHALLVIPFAAALNPGSGLKICTSPSCRNDGATAPLAKAVAEHNPDVAHFIAEAQRMGTSVVEIEKAEAKLKSLAAGAAR